MLYPAHGQVLGQTYYARGHVPLVDFDPWYQNSVLRQHHFLLLFGFYEALHIKLNLCDAEIRKNESRKNEISENEIRENEITEI